MDRAASFVAQYILANYLVARGRGRSNARALGRLWGLFRYHKSSVLASDGPLED